MQTRKTHDGHASLSAMLGYLDLSVSCKNDAFANFVNFFEVSKMAIFHTKLTP
jgi:hypothetical protein